MGICHKDGRENRITKIIGVYAWQNITMLDMMGPQLFFGFVSGFEVLTFAKSKDPVVTDVGVRLISDHDFATCPPFDILLVGGGANPLPEMQDGDIMSFLRQVGGSAEYITSVCTGSLILAHAGLLDGYQATTHWAYQDRLCRYPDVEVVTGRVVTERNRITGGGVTAGIDLGLPLVERLAGLEAAAGLQLLTEYDPQPPTNCGSPDDAPPQLTAAMRQQLDDMAPGLTRFIADNTAPGCAHGPQRSLGRACAGQRAGTTHGDHGQLVPSPAPGPQRAHRYDHRGGAQHVQGDQHLGHPGERLHGA